MSNANGEKDHSSWMNPTQQQPKEKAILIVSNRSQAHIMKCTHMACQSNFLKHLTSAYTLGYYIQITIWVIHKAVKKEIEGDELSCYSGIDLIV